MLGFHRDPGGEKLAAKHRIVSHLGQGGTADVYLAVADGPSGFHKLVVLKVLKQGLRADRELREMFLREARLAARLHHPHVVQTNEVLEVDGTPIMVMEYLEGQPLTQVIVRGRQPPHRFTPAMQLRVLVDALGGLHAAHELTDFDATPLGLVHRDVSPHNVFVTVEGEGKVLDFGIAKLDRLGGETKEGTEVGVIKGKLRYMAPEQLAGEKLDRRADIYSAGVMLWEALAGERMWRDCSEQQIRSRVQAGDLPAPDAGRTGAPPELARISRRALALAPGDRYPTALEMADEIERALSDLGWTASRREIGTTVAQLFDDVRAQTREAIERVVSASAPQVSAPDPEEAARVAAAARARRQRRRLVVALAGGAAVAALGLAALGSWRAGANADHPTLTVAAPAAAQQSSAETARWTGPAAPASATFAATSVDVGPRRRDDDGALPARAAAGARARGAAPARAPARSAPPAATAGSPPATATADDPKGPGLADRAPDPVPATPATPAPPGNGAARVDCGQPFFVDGDGIKRFRPECM